MAFTDRYTTARDVDFIKKVRVAALDACIDVMTESAATAGHERRASFAQLVLAYPDTHVPVIAEIITAHDGSLTPASADQTIKDSVASVWNALSGFDANP